MTDAWSDDLRVLRAAAAERLKSEWLQRWWCKKYNLPRKDTRLDSYTLEELMVEYLEDLIEQDPFEEYPREAQESGDYSLRTGDKLMDEWQEKVKKGEAIDFGAAFTSQEAKDAFERVREESRAKHQAKQAPKVEELPEEFHDDYRGDV